MNGFVDLKGRALLTVLVGASADQAETPAEVWVDTAFTGELVLPLATIRSLGLEQSLVIDAVLGDGLQAEMDTFLGWIDWFGEVKEIEVVASEKQTALLGVMLMLDHRLEVDYRTLTLTLE